MSAERNTAGADRPDTGSAGDPAAGDRVDNGLSAVRFVALADVSREFVPLVLDALRRARIAAYAAATPVPPAPPGGRTDPPDAADGAAAPQLRRVFVSGAELSDARPVMRAALRGLTADGGAAPAGGPHWRDPLDSLGSADTDAAFAALVADWHVDTVAAVRAAERELSREDADWRARLELPAAGATPDAQAGPGSGGDPQDGAPDPSGADEEDHYVPPPPPPLPRLASATVGALGVLALALLMLAFGGWLGLGGDITFMLGVGGILASAMMLLMRLRERPADEDDDGAIV